MFLNWSQLIHNVQLPECSGYSGRMIVFIYTFTCEPAEPRYPYISCIPESLNMYLEFEYSVF